MSRKDSKEQHPAWLKAMQNGAIGEARAKALLLNRFWVLERSVDIEGADFIIQRRLTGRNLLDREAPRLGVVQVKYFGTPTTHHFVHREYVIDDNDEPRNEFFLLCFMGDEESSQSFLVFAKDIAETFQKTIKNNNDGFSITFKELTSNSKYTISNSKMALDRIEKHLELAEFTRNRRFISWALPSTKIETSAIQPEYTEPIDNWWGDIPSSFEDIKRTAQRAMLHVEEILQLLLEVTQETDPLKAEEIIDEISYYCRDGYGKWSISLPDDLYDQDFFNVCKRHKEVYDNLKKDGLLDSYLNMKNELRTYIMHDLESLIPIDSKSAQLFSFTYDPDSFKILSFNSKLIKKEDLLKTYNIDSDHPEGITEYSSGKIEYAWFPGSYGSLDKDVKKNIDWYRAKDFWLYFKCLDAVFSLKYDDNVDL